MDDSLLNYALPSPLGNALTGEMPTFEVPKAAVRKQCCGSTHGHFSWCSIFVRPQPVEKPVAISRHDLASLDKDAAILFNVTNCTVSDEVRTECEKELAEAAQQGWRCEQ